MPSPKARRRGSSPARKAPRKVSGKPSPLAALYASFPTEGEPLRASYLRAVADLFTATLGRALDTLNRLGVTDALKAGKELAFLPFRKRERLQRLEELERRIAEGSVKPVPSWVAFVLEELAIVKALVQSPPDVGLLLSCLARIERCEAEINRALARGKMGERGERPKVRLGVMFAIQDHLAEGIPSYAALLRHFKVHHYGPSKPHHIARPEWTGRVFYHPSKPGDPEGRIVQVDAKGKEASVSVKTFRNSYFAVKKQSRPTR